MKALRQDLLTELNIDLNIEKLVINAVRRFKINYYLYTKLFKKLSASLFETIISETTPSLDISLI